MTFLKILRNNKESQFFYSKNASRALFGVKFPLYSLNGHSLSVSELL